MYIYIFKKYKEKKKTTSASCMEELGTLNI